MNEDLEERIAELEIVPDTEKYKGVIVNDILRDYKDKESTDDDKDKEPPQVALDGYLPLLYRTPSQRTTYHTV